MHQQAARAGTGQDSPDDRRHLLEKGKVVALGVLVRDVALALAPDHVTVEVVFKVGLL